MGVPPLESHHFRGFNDATHDYFGEMCQEKDHFSPFLSFGFLLQFHHYFSILPQLSTTHFDHFYILY